MKSVAAASIREALPEDAEAAGRCVDAAYRHYIERIGKPPGPMLDDYAEVIQRHSVFVAEIDQIVGVLVLIQKHEQLLLDNLAVHPRLQGHGLGKRLLELAEAEAIARGFERLDLYTHASMNENIAMYRSLGYIETRRVSENGYPRIYLHKKLEVPSHES